MIDGFPRFNPPTHWIDRSGERFGSLTVLYRTVKPENIKHDTTYYLCRCDCGNLAVYPLGNLTTGNTKKCKDCQLRQLEAGLRTVHGDCKRGRQTRLFNIWNGMIRRCRPSDISHNHNYGDTVCTEWSEFQPFKDWALAHGYSSNLTIDRIDNSKGYSPDNCRWATARQQARNTSRNHRMCFNGETHCIKEWSEILGLPYGALLSRVKLHPDLTYEQFSRPLKGARP